MSSLLTLYRAYRHRRGYGVHSPYAYMLVRNVLALPAGYSYYAERETSCRFSNGERRLRMAWQRYRWRFGENSGKFFEQNISHRELEALLDHHSLFAIMNPDRESIEIIKNEASSGVLFHGQRGLIYFPNPKVCFVSYEYRF